MHLTRIVGKVIFDRFQNQFFSLDQVVVAVGNGLKPFRNGLPAAPGATRCDGAQARRERGEKPFPTRKQVIDILTIFRQEGLIKQIKKVPKPEKPYGRPIMYTILYRVADRKGLAARIAPKQYEDTIQDRMWFIIRKKRIFTRHDLQILAGAGFGMARWYTKMLRRAGIVGLTASLPARRTQTGLAQAGLAIRGQPAAPGATRCDGAQARRERGEWVLYKDTGPKRPYVGDQKRSKVTCLPCWHRQEGER